ncbi:MAG TPA: cytochrome c3 family protein [Anaeromyxobacteraceae bacterium]|nr:cytochrome c3 family protein [Anaeromyxobacteraceae bacterium]
MRHALAVASLSAALGIAACSHAGAPSTAAPAAPRPEPKVVFQPYPLSEVGNLKTAHEYQGKPLCQACHMNGGFLRADANGTCTRCHAFGHNNHPVDVVQKTKTDLPLLAGGKLACHTCHDPHAVKKGAPGLRKTFNELCTACHKAH